MDIKDIKNLLLSFYEGETSKEEEKTLSDFFATESIPEDMEVERKIFMRLYSAQQNDVPADLEAKLNLLIDNLEEEDANKQTPPIVLPTKHFSNPLRWAMSIAAGILIIISAGLFAYLGNNENEMLVDTYSNPEEAYMETQRTLLLVSGKLNKGIQKMEKVNDIIDKDVQL